MNEQSLKDTSEWIELDDFRTKDKTKGENNEEKISLLSILYIICNVIYAVLYPLFKSPILYSIILYIILPNGIWFHLAKSSIKITFKIFLYAIHITTGFI